MNEEISHDAADVIVSSGGLKLKLPKRCGPMSLNSSVLSEP
jgi:hypothetical protein